jgi:hypothetical protein
MFLLKIILTPESQRALQNIQDGFYMLKKNNENTTLKGLRLIHDNSHRLHRRQIPIIFSKAVIEKLAVILNHHSVDNRELVLLILGLIDTDSAASKDFLLKTLYRYEIKTEVEAHLIVNNLHSITHRANLQRLIAVARKYETNLHLLKAVFEALNKNLKSWKKKPYDFHKELLMLSGFLSIENSELKEKTHEVLRIMGSAAKTTEKDLVERYRMTNDAKEMAQILLTLLKIDRQNQKKYPQIFN